MKEKPVLPLLLSMALPMILSMLVNSLYNIVDSFFVAKISEDAMTALSLVYPIQNFVNAVAIGFGVGINVLIAFYQRTSHRKAVCDWNSGDLKYGTSLFAYHCAEWHIKCIFPDLCGDSGDLL